MTIYLCSPDFEGILCGIYDAWMSLKGHENVRLELRGTYQEMELFSEYAEVEVLPEKAEKVTQSVCRKLSQEVYKSIYVASLSQEGNRADKIYRFLIQAFRRGPGILGQLQIPESYDLFHMCRNVYNENHSLVEFLRFSQAPGGVLVSKIGPKNDIMVLLAPHFADRLPEEDWVIYDVNREKAAVHPKGRGWILVNHPLDQPVGGGIWQLCLEQDTDEREYEELWTAFFHTIAIKERTNPVCQRNHLPMRFRPFMTEFQSNTKF